jgi:hypothetical protein
VERSTQALEAGIDPITIIAGTSCPARSKERNEMKQIHCNLMALLFVAILAFAALHSLGAEETPVKVCEEKIVIPTYLIGAPEPNPMFYFGSESQGAQDRIYPYSLYDTLTHKKAAKTYKRSSLQLGG